MPTPGVPPLMVMALPMVKESVTMSRVAAAAMVSAPVPSAELLLAWMTPSWRLFAPVKVFVPVRVRVPLPSLVRPPVVPAPSVATSSSAGAAVPLPSRLTVVVV